MPLGAEPCAQIIHLKGKFYSSNSSRSQSDQSKIHFSESSVHGEVDLTISVGSKALVDGIVDVIFPAAVQWGLDVTHAHCSTVGNVT